MSYNSELDKLVARHILFAKACKPPSVIECLGCHNAPLTKDGLYCHIKLKPSTDYNVLFKTVWPVLSEEDKRLTMMHLMSLSSVKAMCYSIGDYTPTQITEAILLSKGVDLPSKGK